MEIDSRTNFLEAIDYGFYLTFAGSLAVQVGCPWKLALVPSRQDAAVGGGMIAKWRLEVCARAKKPGDFVPLEILSRL